MKMRFESRPPFVYYFNPDIQVEEDFGINADGIRYYQIAFYSKGTYVRLLKDNCKFLVLFCYQHFSLFQYIWIMYIEYSKQ